MGGGERDGGKLPCNGPQTVVVARLGDRRGRVRGRLGLGPPGHEQPGDDGENEQEEMPGGHDAQGYQGPHEPVSARLWASPEHRVTTA